MKAKVPKSTKVKKGVKFFCDNADQIRIGARCHIKTGVVFNAYSGDIVVGDRVSIGEYSIFYAHGNIHIHDGVAIAPHCVLSAQRHIWPSKVGLRFSGETLAPIKIEAGAILSAGCVVASGVTIGRGALVGAGSIVLSNVPAYCFAAGSPCKVLRKCTRNEMYGYEGSLE